MSGLEVASIVLDAFPILVGLLKEYRRGLEKLRGWRNFKKEFGAFVDAIERENMIYRDNLSRLLEPIVENRNSLETLLKDTKDPRWADGSLIASLEVRLVVADCGRFFRLIERMEKDINRLRTRLELKDDNTADWFDSKSKYFWKYQWKRFYMVFLQDRDVEIQRLQSYNQTMKEILDCCDREALRSIPNPARTYDRIRQHACGMHNALRLHWNCNNQGCRSHRVYLAPCAEPRAFELSALFFFQVDDEGSHSVPMLQDVVIQSPEDINILRKQSQGGNTCPKQIGNKPSSLLDSRSSPKSRFKPLSWARLSRLFSKRPRQKSSLCWSPTSAKSGKRFHSTYRNGNRKGSKKDKKRSRSTTSMPLPTTNQDKGAGGGPTATAGNSTPAPDNITELCSSLRASEGDVLGTITDGSGHQFQLSKPCPVVKAPSISEVFHLPKIINDLSEKRIKISRRDRIEMALNIASAVLQLDTSPWLPRKWSKRHFYFIVGSGTLLRRNVFVCQHLPLDTTTTPAPTPTPGFAHTTMDRASLDPARRSLSTLGIIILELIFGQNIEACHFRATYCGPNRQAYDKTNVSTARAWAKEVPGEHGFVIYDVIRRCLDCAFKSRPDFTDKEFREEVYEDVIKPLLNFLKSWDAPPV